MRNRFGGYCYRCTLWVQPGEGHFERIGGGWRVQHAECAIECRGKPEEFVLEYRARKIEVERRRERTDG